MSDNGAVTAPQVNIDVERVLEILREENPQALELAVRRATIEAQSKLIEELRAPKPGT